MSAQFIVRILFPMIWPFIFFGSSTVMARQIDDPRQTDVESKPDFGLVQESRAVFKNEMKPIQDRISQQSSKFQRRHTLETLFVNRLESIDEKSLETVRQEMQELADRMEMLERLENVLTDMDPEAVAKAIADGKNSQDELQQLRQASTRPIQQELTQLQQEYSGKNQALAKLLDPFFRPVGRGEFKSLKRSHSSATFAYAIYSCSYIASDKMQFNITLHLQPQTIPMTQNLEKLDDRYPIYYWNNSSLSLFVGGIQVTAYGSQAPMTKRKLMDALKQLVDLEKLAALQ